MQQNSRVHDYSVKKNLREKKNCIKLQQSQKICKKNCKECKGCIVHCLHMIWCLSGGGQNRNDKKNKQEEESAQRGKWLKAEGACTVAEFHRGVGCSQKPRL